MSQSPPIVQVTQANFRREVVERSHDVPVLVDFWAAWCQPCQVLLPVLTALAEEYAGAFVLAKVDTETEQSLAAEHGIRSIPTLKLFRHGKVVKEIAGAQPEAVFRKLIDEYRERPSNAVLDQAKVLWEAGRTQEALKAVNQAWLEDRDNHSLAVTLALWLSDLQRFDEAKAVADAVPKDAVGVDVTGLKASLRFKSTNQNLPPVEVLKAAVERDPKDLDARHQLALARIAAGDTEDGLEDLLAILRRDASWNEGGARRSMLDVFQILGEQDPLVGRYRRAMFAAIH